MKHIKNKRKFKTLSEYDDEIEVYNRILDILKRCVKVYLKEGTLDYELLRYIHKLEKAKEDLEFYKATQEALDRCDASKEGMSVDEFLKEFTRQINRSIIAENQILITELNSIKKLLNDLYEEINGNYIETLGRDDELAIDCADAQLKLIKEIIDRVEKI